MPPPPVLATCGPPPWPSRASERAQLAAVCRDLVLGSPCRPSPSPGGFKITLQITTLHVASTRLTDADVVTRGADLTLESTRRSSTAAPRSISVAIDGHGTISAGSTLEKAPSWRAGCPEG